MRTFDRRFILSDPPPKITGVHHPWHWLRDCLPDWQVVQLPMPTGVLGATDSDGRRILLEPGQTQAQMRCTLDHELLHAAGGDHGCQHRHREQAINAESARRLIPLSLLLETVVWAHWLDELAEECWVDSATMQCRLDNLTDRERVLVRAAITSRDFHEEGMP